MLLLLLLLQQGAINSQRHAAQSMVSPGCPWAACVCCTTSQISSSNSSSRSPALHTKAHPNTAIRHCCHTPTRWWNSTCSTGTSSNRPTQQLERIDPTPLCAQTMIMSGDRAVGCCSGAWRWKCGRCSASWRALLPRELLVVGWEAPPSTAARVVVVPPPRCTRLAKRFPCCMSQGCGGTRVNLLC